MPKKKKKLKTNQYSFGKMGVIMYECYVFVYSPLVNVSVFSFELRFCYYFVGPRVLKYTETNLEDIVHILKQKYNTSGIPSTCDVLSLYFLI